MWLVTSVAVCTVVLALHTLLPTWLNNRLQPGRSDYHGELEVERASNFYGSALKWFSDRVLNQRMVTPAWLWSSCTTNFATLTVVSNVSRHVHPIAGCYKTLQVRFLPKSQASLSSFAASKSLVVNSLGTTNCSCDF
jgi:hypothetical protein